MRLHAGFAVIAWLLLAPALAQEAVRLPCAASDKPCLRQLLRDHAVGRVATWQLDLGRPLDSRVGPAPQPLIEFLTIDNVAQGIAQNEFQKIHLRNSQPPGRAASASWRCQRVHLCRDA